MGNYNTRPIIFRQSQSDFPLTVSLGNTAPAWGLSRWHGNSGLRFVPPDDEGFTLRGDTRRLVYKGRRRSHRFTILADGAFEYDVILNKEPESNVIVLPMEGAEQFDFFRQPDFVKDPLLAGSYAVYKKETLIGEGTGKLCHIHRPEIIDARGWRCWGDLSVAGNCLYITIPEQWLAEAEYPVVVDPTVGTTTVGSQYQWRPDPPPEPMVTLYLEIAVTVNRFLINEKINGLCTAYFYTNEDDYDGGGRPVFYSDNGNSPLFRKSKNEQWTDFRVTSTKPKGWRSATFMSNDIIESGSYIWFGCHAEYFWYPRFDYGSKCYWDSWDDYYEENTIRDIYPMYNVNMYDNFKWSMYFTYTSAQNYVRKITQGVSLNDKKKLTGEYKRSARERTVPVDNINNGFFFKRLLFNMVLPLESIHKKASYFRTLKLRLEGITEINKKSDYYRENIENVKPAGLVSRGLLFFVRIVTGVFARDYIFGRFLKAREELKIKSCITRDITLNSKII